ncbi:DUF3800 domain-containing protein [Undibacterium sp.]|uniref:DUF3800 domain-containing protein n=1 Tax=Undibacterium sp. TaxID=1914977 RepID=UPI002731DA24|nr:DUF3800 domain-containing protein [Undibacterium sp.]MDP1976267.1 DUF3800 domain-containing protein [Undibacterium sp.]
MFIFVDESGNFTLANQANSWCVVAAYVVPEHRRQSVRRLISEIHKMGKGAGSETKCKDLSEAQYIWFLTELKKLDGLVFAIATDVGMNRPHAIEHHRDLQAKNIIEHRDKMNYEEGRDSLTKFSMQVNQLSIPLYMQTSLQVSLFHRILTQATLYYAQRHPPALGNFRWRVDQKNTKKDLPNSYENIFLRMLAPAIQSRSLREKLLVLESADYRHFSRFEYPPGKQPNYLKEIYGIENIGGPDLRKIIWENFQYVDSAKDPGVQIADLLAGGIRRLLRGNYVEEAKISELLGANMVQAIDRESPLQFASLDQVGELPDRIQIIANSITRAAKGMLK